jgi:hypothetical protein
MPGATAVFWHTFAAARTRTNSVPKRFIKRAPSKWISGMLMWMLASYILEANKHSVKLMKLILSQLKLQSPILIALISTSLLAD